MTALRRLLQRDWGLVGLTLGCMLAFLWTASPFLWSGSVFGLLWRQARSWAAGVPASPAERFFEAVKTRPPLLRAFLQQFPKGGNLHVHLTGAVYLERLIAYAQDADRLDALCVAGEPVRILKCPEDAAVGENLVRLKGLLTGDVKPGDPMPAALQGSFPFQRLIDATTLRNYAATEGSSSDQFFGAFGAVGALFEGDAVKRGLQELQQRDEAQGLRYFEVMTSLQDVAGESFSKTVVRLSPGAAPAWPVNQPFGPAQLQAMTEPLLGFVRERAVAATQFLDDKNLGGCAGPSCDTDLRFIQQINRNVDPLQFLAQLLFARELLAAAKSRPVQRVVGLNIVAPEHAPVSRMAVEAQMAMIRAVCGDPESACAGRVAIHAGELVIGMAPPPDLQTHIGEAVAAGARRIGHGVAIGFEASPPNGSPYALLSEMADKRIAVEINLSSNRTILGVTGRQHPMRDYMAFGVPVVLSTDDEGIARSDVTNEWVEAVLDQGIGYRDLVAIARNSLQYSFLAGASLWAQDDDPAKPLRRAAACNADDPRANAADWSAPCRDLLRGSEKAARQWRLEADLAAFEGQDWNAVARRGRMGDLAQ